MGGGSSKALPTREQIQRQKAAGQSNAEIFDPYFEDGTRGYGGSSCAARRPRVHSMVAVPRDAAAEAAEAAAAGRKLPNRTASDLGLGAEQRAAAGARAARGVQRTASRRKVSAAALGLHYKQHRANLTAQAMRNADVGGQLPRLLPKGLESSLTGFEEGDGGGGGGGGGGGAATAAAAAAMTDEARAKISEALHRVLFTGLQLVEHLDAVLQEMRPVQLRKGQVLFAAGEVGRHFFVLQSGSIQLSKRPRPAGEAAAGEAASGKLATLGPGDFLGELALIYKCKRSVTAVAVCDCCLWRLERRAFRRVMSRAGYKDERMHVTWLRRVPLLRDLPERALQRLASSMALVQLRDGERIQQEGEVGTTCFLVKHGHVKWHSKADSRSIGGSRQASCQPSRMASPRVGGGIGGGMPSPLAVLSGNVLLPPAALGGSGGGGGGAGPSTGTAVSTGNTLDLAASKLNRLQHVSERPPARAATSSQYRGFAGAFVGEAALVRAPASLTVLADGPVVCATFDVATYRYLASGVALSAAPSGAATPVLGGRQLQSQLQSASSSARTSPSRSGTGTPVAVGTPVAAGTPGAAEGGLLAAAVVVGAAAMGSGGGASGGWVGAGAGAGAGGEGLSLRDCEELGFLGKGAFGLVTLVRCAPRAGATGGAGGEGEGELCALKRVSKGAVVKAGQVRNALEEKAVLHLLSHPFIMRLHGTFTDERCAYFLLEHIDGCDLFKVAHERGAVGMEPSHAAFYCGGILLALEHMHGRGVVHRDLKCENVMIAADGYVRIIDLGLAKRIPFVATSEQDGSEELHYRSYTVCGTPEYLAPEFILNTGSNAAADVWSFGVLLHELLAGYTPFVDVQNPGNIEELFKNIACARQFGVPFAPSFKEEHPLARRLLGRLLHWDPERRPKATPDGDTGFRSYSFFKGSVDLEALEAKRLPPPFKPKAGGVEAAAAAAAAAGGPGGQAPPFNCPSFDDTEGLFDGF